MKNGDEYDGRWNDNKRTGEIVFMQAAPRKIERQ